QTKCAERRQPLGQEILDETHAQHELRLLIEPHLRDVERKQDPCKLREDDQLLRKLGEVLVRERVVKWLVPGVEPDLRVSGRADDRDQGDDQKEDRVALSRRPERRYHPPDLGEKAPVRTDRSFGAARFYRLSRHRTRSS